MTALWTTMALRHVAEVRGGLTKGRDLSGHDTTSVPYLRVANVQDGHLLLDDVATIEATAGDIDRYALEAGDVLMNEGGDADKLGRGAVWHGQISPCLHQNHVFCVRPGSFVLPQWLNYVTSSDPAKYYFESRSKQTTGIASISSSNLKGLPVPLPPLPTQRAIAAFLDRKTAAIDALIEKKERLIALLAEKRAALIHDRLDSHSTMVKLGHIVDLLSGYAFPSDGYTTDESDVPLLRGINISPGSIRWDEVVRWPLAKTTRVARWILEPGDIVIGLDRPWISSGLRVARLTDKDCPALLLQRVARIRCGPRILPAFLLLALEWDRFQQHVEPNTTGVSVPHISPGQVQSYRVPLPSIEVQAAIVDKVGALLGHDSRTAHLSEQSLDHLHEYRQALITAAVTGQLDIDPS